MAGEGVEVSERDCLIELAWQTEQLITSLSRLAGSYRTAGLAGAADHWATEVVLMDLTLLGIRQRITSA